MRYRDLVESTGYFSKIPFRYNPFDIPENDLQGFRNQLQEFLETHCSEALTDYRTTGMLLYRALKWRDTTPAVVLYNKAVPGMRTPVDSHLKGQNFVNEILTVAGFEARRDNSIFTTSVERNTYQYGNSVYLVFPINGFKFTFSKNTKDWISITNTFSSSKIYHWIQYELLDAFVNKFIKIVKRKTGNNVDTTNVSEYNIMDKAKIWLSEPNEYKILEIIKFNGLWDLYYFLREESDRNNPITDIDYIKYINKPIYDCLSPYLKAMVDYFKTGKITPEIAEAIIEKFEIQNFDFVSAIGSENEVMIHGDNVMIRWDNDWKNRLLSKKFIFDL